MVTWSSAAVRAAMDLLLPRICAVCDATIRDFSLVCGLCWARCEPLPHPRCQRCGHPLTSERCRYCPAFAPYVRAIRSWTWMHKGTGAAIVHALKYGGWWAVGGEMAERMARLDWPPDVITERALVIPVPLANPKRRERGYNQCAVIAARLAEVWRVPMHDDVLQRTRATRTQTRLTPGERLANVSGAFSVSSTARRLLKGAHVVLLDDVITTGATLDACARALLDAGCRITSFVTFGRAPAAGDR